jgi:hypothetical protein
MFITSSWFICLTLSFLFLGLKYMMLRQLAKSLTLFQRRIEVPQGKKQYCFGMLG